MKMMLYQNVFVFMMKLLFLSFLQKKILKLKEPVKSYWKIYMTLAANSEITKKLHDDLKLVVKKGADKSFQLT